MSGTESMLKHFTVAALLLTATATSAALMGQAAAPVLVRGTIVSLDGMMLRLTARDGSARTVVLAPATNVATTSVIGIDAIKANSFIGTAAEPGKDGSLRATEVHVFPEAMRGLGEGHRPWDLSKTSSMTNGNVRTVGKPRHGKGRELIVDYQGGQQTVVVPLSVPIVAFAAGSLVDLKPGARVFAVTRAGADGALATNQLVVGANGSTPPM